MQAAICPHIPTTLAFVTWPHHDFPTVVKAAFELTPDNDRGLRSAVTKVCADDVGDLLLLESPSALEMRDLPRLGFDLLSIVKKRCDEENERLSSINAVAEVELHNKSEEARKLTRDRDLWQLKYELLDSKVDSIFESVLCSRACRHCTFVGCMTLERIPHPTELSAIFRCPKCRTRHNLG